MKPVSSTDLSQAASNTCCSCCFFALEASASALVEEKVIHWGLLGFQHQQRLVVRVSLLFKERRRLVRSKARSMRVADAASWDVDRCRLGYRLRLQAADRVP